MRFNREDYGSRLETCEKTWAHTGTLAEKMNVSTPYIAKIENGKQTGPIELAVEFAEILLRFLWILSWWEKEILQRNKSADCGWPFLFCLNWRHLSKNFPFWVGELSILFLLEELVQSYNLHEIKTSHRTLKNTASLAVISGNLNTLADRMSVRPSARRPPVRSISHQRTAI